MEELKVRVDQMVKQQMDIERAALQEQKDQLEQQRQDLLDEMADLKITLEHDATGRSKDCTDALREAGKAFHKMTPKTNEDVRKPSKFEQPTLATTTDGFFKDYERYIRGWKPNVPEATATYLPLYLFGEALAFYDRQSPEVKDVYDTIKDAMLQYFIDTQEELRTKTVKEFDPSKQGIGEYLKEAKEFFSAKRIDDADAILQLQMRLKDEYQDAILIHKPKNWTDLCRWLRNAQSSSKTTHSVQAILDVTPTIFEACAKPMKKQLEELQQELKASREENETLAAMGGGKPTYNRAPRTPTQGKYPDLPPGHVINSKYTGPPEKYDPSVETCTH